MPNTYISVFTLLKTLGVYKVLLKDVIYGVHSTGILGPGLQNFRCQAVNWASAGISLKRTNFNEIIDIKKTGGQIVSVSMYLMLYLLQWSNFIGSSFGQGLM